MQEHVVPASFTAFLLRRKQVVKCCVIASMPENVPGRESPRQYDNLSVSVASEEPMSRHQVFWYQLLNEVPPQLKQTSLKQLGQIFIQEVLFIPAKSLTRTDHRGGGSSLGSTAKSSPRLCGVETINQSCCFSQRADAAFNL